LKNKFVSIIIPCRNEENFIYKVLENILAQTYGVENMEVIVVDGMSTDNTTSEIQRFQNDQPTLSINAIENPQKVVPFALNRAIKLSKGDVIVRLDAHSVYPANYISRLVDELDARPDAWNVGGCWDTQAGANTNEAKAIVLTSSHPVGIGNADYRLSGKKIKEVDTVPFGCFRREVFDKIGLFDEDLIRNQDDEFNARIIENGGKIFLIPDLKIQYFARPTLSKMSKMFYQYGYYKPLVNKKINKPATLRQFAPLLLVIGFIAGWIPALFWPFFACIYLIGIGFYLISLLFVALTLGKSVQVKLFCWITFILIHFSYGWGYLIGIFDFLLRGVEKKGKTVNISR
jgi:glycosyltransferase involved in cell wall biosynthesis